MNRQNNLISTSTKYIRITNKQKYNYIIKKILFKLNVIYITSIACTLYLYLCILNFERSDK